MDEVTFTSIRSSLPVIDDGANSQGKRYVLVRHRQKRLVILGVEDYEKLVAQAGGKTESPVE